EAADIGAVISHAMGHASIDLADARAIERVVGQRCPVVAPIAAMGHTGAASAAIGLATAVGIVTDRRVPPTVNAEARDPDCRVNLLRECQPLERPAVLVISHTPQGHAAAVVLAAAE